MKANFETLSVQVNFEGEPIVMDIRKQLGNLIRKSTSDIGFDEVARQIYFSSGDIDIPDEYIEPIKQLAAKNFIVPVQEAINKMFNI